MSTFTELMRISKSQTQESQSAAQAALADKKRREEQRRKQQLEKERKERELEQKLRMKHFEEEKKEKERQLRREAEQKAKELALQRREEEQRDALRYGPKKAASKWPSSASHDKTREDVRRGRMPGDDDDDSPGGLALTREEKRERKLQAELRRTFHTAKRSATTGGYLKGGRRLPGGAVDITDTPASSNLSSANMTVKERIAAMPNTLTKLNTVKRDTRTIDEILQDRAKARVSKVIDGDSAREFNDWFSTKKKDSPTKAVSSGTTATTQSAPGSGANTPLGSHGSLGSISGAPKSGNFSKLSTSSNPSATKSSNVASAKAANAQRSDRQTLSKTPSSKLSKSSVPLSRSGSHTPLPQAKKRQRSESFSPSPSPPPSKKRSTTPSESSNYRDVIWQMFGKSRDRYVQQDVFSDDEEMEAGASDLEKEEKISARIARREEELALAEERRHEEEKRKKRMSMKRQAH